MIATNETLLDRIKAMDAHEAWQEFYDCYWAPILRYARKLGLSEMQSRDVLQETMVALMRTLPTFNYDSARGRFRNFLLTIVHRQSLAAMQREKRQRNESWNENMHGTIRAAKPAPATIEEKDIQRWKQSVAQEALNDLQNDPSIDPRTWAIFNDYVLMGKPASDVALGFKIKPNAVYQIKNRLLTRLQKRTLQRLRDSGMDAAYPE